MNIESVVLRRSRIPLVSAFRTSYGREEFRDLLLIEVKGSDAIGWGECAALGSPFYSSEYADGAHAVMRSHLIPMLATASPVLLAADVAKKLAPVKGHQMAKAAIEMAVLDGELREQGRSLSSFLGSSRNRVEAGISIGIAGSITELCEEIARYLDEGYRRVKLKIEPGWDIEPVAAVRSHFGSDLPLQVDANGAYTRSDIEHLANLDEFSLLLLEQPLGHDNLAGHAELAHRINTPVCLDESITSAAIADDAIARGACSVINIKAGRLGGYLEAKRVHDICVDRGVAVWCGGMLESGLGRAANVALAALPGFTLPSDLSASARYFLRDLTDPFVLEDGFLRVPEGPGIGVSPDPVFLEEVTLSVEEIPFRKA